MSTVIRAHRWRISWLEKREAPVGNGITGMFVLRHARCCAVSRRQALERVGAPPMPLGLRTIRESVDG